MVLLDFHLLQHTKQFHIPLSFLGQTLGQLLLSQSPAIKLLLLKLFLLKWATNLFLSHLPWDMLIFLKLIRVVKIEHLSLFGICLFCLFKLFLIMLDF